MGLGFRVVVKAFGLPPYAPSTSSSHILASAIIDDDSSSLCPVSSRPTYYLLILTPRCSDYSLQRLWLAQGSG